MLITHAMNAINNPKITKAQTPNRKIKHIVTNKNHLLNNNGMNKIPSNKKLSLNNKENQHPNIRKSPSQQTEKSSLSFVNIHPNERVKQNRVKSQYYSSAINTTKQSPIKKILFVKNLCYKSTKTSKNSSLDNKNHQNHQASSSQQKYLSLNHNSERNNNFYQKQSHERKSYSNGNKTFMQNESQIHQQQKVVDKGIQQFRAKDNLLQKQNHQSQANYRMTIAPNQLHPKMTQFNQKYASYQGQSHSQQSQNQNKPNLTRMNSFDCSTNGISSQNVYQRNNFNNNNAKMCPNIQSANLSQLQSFKKNNFLLPQQKKQTIKALISIDKEKKQSLSSKKRNSRIKINYKASDKFKQSFNNDDLVTQQSEIITISSPSHPIFDEKMKLNNSPNLQSERDSKSSISKNTFDESTLIETKKVNETCFNLSDQFSKITLNESRQSHQANNQSEKKIDEKKYCKNHPQKLAKYHLNKKVDKPYYCKKCSANIISLQGCQVIEKFRYCETQRLEKLNQFISKIQAIGPKLSKSKISIGAMEQQICSIIKKSRQQIETYYKKLHETLQSHKQSTINALLFHSQKTFRQMSKFRKAINFNEQEISFMKSDIMPNIDSIIDEDKLAEENFKQIITEHQTKLQSIDALIMNISNLIDGKENKIVMKTVQIPLNQLKSALNVLQRTQIVFAQKIVKVNPKDLGHNHFHNMSIGHENQIINNSIKKDFSFDDENIDTSFYVPSSKKKNRNENPSMVQNFYQLTDSIRLSFGNKFESSPSPIKSPTFKII